MTFEHIIPSRSKKVLEINDGSEETSRENFLEIQPFCDYKVSETFEGIEEKFDAILLQSSAFDRLDEKSLSELMKKLADKLNRRGLLIFTLDNIGNAENITAILENKPPKFKTTLTQIELEETLKKSGLNFVRLIKVQREIAVKKMLVELSKTELAVFKYVITATKEELPEKILIHSLIGEEKVCAPIRIYMPNSFFVAEPNVFTANQLPSQPLKILGEDRFKHRIFINQRQSYNDFIHGKEIFDTLANAGYLYIDEMDDHPILWQKSYEASGWINFAGVHGIQTSTKYLADFLKQFNPNVKIFANHLRRLPPPRNFDEEFKQENRPVTIFFGALNRNKEFRELMPILKKFSEKYGDKIQFKILAHKKLYDEFDVDNKSFVGDLEYYDGQFIPFDRYEKEIRTSEIALLPLIDSIFNRAKSDLKFIESAANGAAVLASSVVYSDVVKNGKTGFIYNDLKDFSDKLKILIDDKIKRREMAEAAYDYVKHNRLMSQHYEERLDWYRELIAKLPELNKETQIRIEKIAKNFLKG